MKELIETSKVKGELDSLVTLLELNKMSGFFLECQRIGDKSSIQLILEQIGVSSIDFHLDILLYSIENFDSHIQQIFVNLFKEATLKEQDEQTQTIIGEVLKDGMIIIEENVIGQDIIDEMVDQ